jgi:hypothetical protein
MHIVFRLHWVSLNLRRKNCVNMFRVNKSLLLQIKSKNSYVFQLPR